MLHLFDSVKNLFRIKLFPVYIDNWIFQLHYCITTTIFLVASILVSSRQYIGDHIKCLVSLNKDFTKAVETYCFFNATFTLKQNKLPNFEKYGILSYFQHEYGKNYEISHHTYYQWVPFVLFGQSIMFHLTHIFWKNLEDGRIRKIVRDLKHSTYALSDKEIEIGGERIPSRTKIDNCIKRIKKAFFQRVATNKSWARWLIFCEVLNVLHVVLEIYLTDKFLGGQFCHLGKNVMKEGYPALDQVFPKAGRCIYRKYGPSGSIQKHDILCILALNIINEKIYIVVWFWFVFLLGASCLAVFWRFYSFFVYKKSTLFNQVVFGLTTEMKMHPWHCKVIARSFSYADWLFLRYLAKNLDGRTFKQLFVGMSEDMEEDKSIRLMEMARPKYH